MNLSVDWSSVFVPAIGLAEIVVRGSLMYLGLFIILRFKARRQAGHFEPADLLVIVLIADAAQNGLGKDYGSVTEDWCSSLRSLRGNTFLIGSPGAFRRRAPILCPEPHAYS
jgi:hypothetical protein